MTLTNQPAMSVMQQVRRIGLVASVAMTMLMVLPGVAAAPGDLDTSFGIGGQVTTDFGNYDSARALALQADGKIVAAGSVRVGINESFTLARYNADGTLDHSFGIGGRVTTDFNDGSGYAHALAIQGDGKIVAAGYAFGRSSYDFALARYNADGTLDHSFGSGGRVTTDFSISSDSANALAIQGDGKIIAAGRTYVGYNIDFALARYTADGTLDYSFGIGGRVTTDFSRDDYARALAIQSDGNVVAAGYAFGRSSYDFALARYTADGTLDHNFGIGGQVITDFSRDDYAQALALQADDKIVVAGGAYVEASRDFALARYTADGTLDHSFGIGGLVTTDFNGSDDYAYALTIQGDGKIVAAGSAYVRSFTDFALARYTGTPTSAPHNGTPRTIPGLIQAEDYDTGGQAVSYYDITPGNIGEQYRADDVDIKPSTDEGGGYAVGWFAAGEWLSYTVDVEEAGTYDIEVRVGSLLPDRTFHIEVGGVDVTGSINVPQTDDWDRYETVRISGVSLTAGRQRVRVVMNDVDYMDINWINFALSNSSASAVNPGANHRVGR